MIRISYGLGLLFLSLFMIMGESVQGDLFEKAILNDSTAPSYVLVKVCNVQTEISRMICTEAPFLLGAIHIEYNIPYDRAGSEQAIHFALANNGKVFRFSKPNAIESVKPRYSFEVLLEVRKLLEPLSDQELLMGFHTGNNSLHKIYENRDKDYGQYRDAVACVLLERGIPSSSRRGCVSGNLIINQ